MPNPLTLYDAEDNLLAMLETEDSVTPEMELEFQKQLGESLKTAIDKRERVGQFILQLEANAKFAREEVKRIEAKARFWESAAKRLRGYVLNVIQEIGPNKKGDLQKLEGHTLTMSARALPTSVEVIEGDLVPLKYKDVSIIFSGDEWAKMKESLNEDVLKELEPRLEWRISRALIKGAITRGETVPGAELLVGGQTLSIK